jgi:hypothetical protein
MLVKQAIRATQNRKKQKKVKRKNRQRVKAALDALKASDPDEVLADGSPALMKCNFVDLVANICHLAHREGIDMQEVFETAWNQYEDEAS